MSPVRIVALMEDQKLVRLIVAPVTSLTIRLDRFLSRTLKLKHASECVIGLPLMD